MIQRPLCEHPIIIFNRNSIYNLLNQSTFYISGKQYFSSYYRRDVWRQHFDYKYFNSFINSFYIDKKKHVIDYQSLEDSFCGFDSFGNKVYLYIVVECGHCLLCSDKRQNDFVSRCNMESQMSLTRPIMVTLTYAPPYLPFVKDMPLVYKRSSFDDGVSFSTIPLITRNVPYRHSGSSRYAVIGDSYKGFRPTVLVRDIQLFFKRLRIRWQRAGKTCALPLRYCCFAEYGHKTKRPHYHLLLWNVPYNITSVTDTYPLSLLKEDILSAWSMCETQACQCEVARNAASYVSKYISKNITSSDYKGFRLCSNRHGGIGSTFIQSRLDYLRKYPSVHELSYIDKWSGKSMTSTIGRYVKNKVYPSVSSLIPAAYKQSLRHDSFILSQLYRIAYHLNDKQLMSYCVSECKLNIYPKYLPFSLSENVHVPSWYLRMPFYTFYLDLIDELISVHHSIWSDFKSCLLSQSQLDYFANIRNEYFKYLSLQPVTDEIIYRNLLKIKQKRAIAESKETL